MEIEQIGWHLRDNAFHASRLIGELDRLDAEVRDPVDQLALSTVREWARSIVRFVHEPIA